MGPNLKVLVSLLNIVNYLNFGFISPHRCLTEEANRVQEHPSPRFSSFAFLSLPILRAPGHGGAPSQVIYLYSTTDRKIVCLHPCPGRDSNLRSQCPNDKRSIILMIDREGLWHKGGGGQTGLIGKTREPPLHYNCPIALLRFPTYSIKECQNHGGLHCATYVT
jgi:hypothetical protein